jgi:pimeloyl-ACP methyl ester carboxylesterase
MFVAPALPQPMLARPDRLPRGDYGYEVKWDGFRALVSTEDGLLVRSRRGWDMTGLLPELAHLPAGLALDGELVVIGPDRVPSFPLLTRRLLARDASVPALLMVFDVLRVEDEDAMGLPYGERRKLLDALDLHDVTLVGCDQGAAQMVAADHPDRLARLVLLPQEAFDNCPPGLPGRGIWLASKVPGGVTAMLQPLRLRAPRRTPMTFGWMAKRPIPDDVMDDWLHPLFTERGVRRDLVKYLRHADIHDFERVADELRAFDKPALVVWGPEDRVMPPEHGRRFAELLPQGRLVEVADSYTLIPEDQPAALADAIRRFVRETS